MNPPVDRRRGADEDERHHGESAAQIEPGEVNHPAAQNTRAGERFEARGRDDEKHHREGNHAGEMIRHHRHRDDQLAPRIVAHQQDDACRVAAKSAHRGKAEEAVDHGEFDGAAGTDVERLAAEETPPAQGLQDERQTGEGGSGGEPAVVQPTGTSEDRVVELHVGKRPPQAEGGERQLEEKNQECLHASGWPRLRGFLNLGGDGFHIFQNAFGRA